MRPFRWLLGQPSSKPSGFADAQVRFDADRRSRWPVEGVQDIPEETGTRPPRAGEAGISRPRDDGPGEVRQRSPSPPPASANGEKPFSEHGGPQGHRKRMREKLVARGVDALADYELLEMLLFYVGAKATRSRWRNG